eukprot:TCONS_00066307-protein
MQETLKQAKDSNDSQFEQMSKIAKVYNSNRECSIQEAVYLTMPELWLRKCFPAISFVNTNLSNQRYRIFKSKEEIEELPEDSDDLFKRNMLNRYIDPISYLNNLRSHFLIPNIFLPTRITDHSMTLIDNIFSSISEKRTFS